MHSGIDATHDPARGSWVESANAPGTDFPIQNLPFGVFETGGSARGGVALGEFVVDLDALCGLDVLRGGALEAARAASGPSLAPLLARPLDEAGALRAQLSNLFRAGGNVDRNRLAATLVPMAEVTLRLPLKPTAFTDFCTSVHHIRRMAGASGAPLKPAWLSLPVAYNGRASSVAVSGTPVIRPRGQFELPPGSGTVHFGPEPMLDFELEFGAWLLGGNALGESLSVAQARETIFGFCLVNDWSARGIQFFEMLLGPHLGKSFITTVSPWIVTTHALAPFRVAPCGRQAGEPAVPAYLLDDTDRRTGAMNIELTADLISAAGACRRITMANLADLFWTIPQMVAHQASNGAPIEAGDLIATGTVSGAADEARACLAEITARGGAPIELPDGTRRVMLEDGDTLAIHGRASAPGYVSIGFGACSGTIYPAKEAL